MNVCIVPDQLRSRSVIDRLPQSTTVFYPDGLSTPTYCDSGHTTHAVSTIFSINYNIVKW